LIINDEEGSLGQSTYQPNVRNVIVIIEEVLAIHQLSEVKDTVPNF